MAEVDLQRTIRRGVAVVMIPLSLLVVLAGATVNAVRHDIGLPNGNLPLLVFVVGVILLVASIGFLVMDLG